MVQGCKRHRSNGCEHGGLRCPYCLVLPCLTILQKISNHLELIKGEQLPPISHCHPIQGQISKALLYMYPNSVLYKTQAHMDC